MTDREGAIPDVSQSATRLLGYAPAEMVGRGWSEFIHPDDKVTEPGTDDASRESVALRRLVLRLRHADGSWRWVEAVRNDLLAEPDVNAIVINWWDITDRVQSEEARKALEGQLQRAQKMEAVERAQAG